jgi:hypothetical protein
MREGTKKRTAEKERKRTQMGTERKKKGGKVAFNLVEEKGLGRMTGARKHREKEENNG